MPVNTEAFEKALLDQSTTKRMTQEEFTYLYNKKNPIVWENLPNSSCKLSDLDHNEIKEIVRIAVSEKRLSF